MNRRSVRYVALLAWMGVIFWASATPDLKTVPIAQQMHLLPAWMSPEATHLLELLLRKSAHMIAFAVLAILARWCFGGSRPAFGLAALYAITDEVHQTFVPGRDGRATDVLIDAAGAAIGLGFLYVREARRRRWTSRLERGE